MTYALPTTGTDPKYATKTDHDAEVNENLDLRLLKTANLSDLASASASRTSLGLGDTSTQNADDLPVSTAQAAAIAVVQGEIDTHVGLTDNPHSVTKAQVGLSNADNTSDLDKPVSVAQAAAIDLVNARVDRFSVLAHYVVDVTGSPVPLGGYYASKYGMSPGNYTRFLVKTDGEATVVARINGIVVAAAAGVNGTIEQAVSIDISIGDEVTFWLTDGTPTSILVQLDQETA